MDSKQTIAILQIISAEYPKRFENQSAEQKKLLLNIWSELLADESYEDVLSALKSYMSQNNAFAPTVGQLKNEIQKNKPKGMTGNEAWDLVKIAIRNGIYGAKEEFEKLPPKIQKVLISPMTINEWSQVPSEDLNFIKTSFVRDYERMMDDEDRLERFPGTVKSNLITFKNGALRLLEDVIAEGEQDELC